MKKTAEITCVILDIGGVLLTDGWDHHAGKRAVAHFELQWTAKDGRRRPTFETYEAGKVALKEYLGRVVFHEKRLFSRALFRRFMFAQSKLQLGIIELLAQLKLRQRLKIAVRRKIALAPSQPRSDTKLGSLVHDKQYPHAGTAAQDGCLLARRQLCVGRSDLSV